MDVSLPPSRGAMATAALLIVAALALHLSWLQASVLPLAQGSVHRQLAILTDGLAFLREGWGRFMTELWFGDQRHAPLLQMMTMALRETFGPHPWVLHFPGLLAMLLTAGATWWIGRNLFSPWTATLATALVLLAPIHVGQARLFDVSFLGSAAILLALCPMSGFRLRTAPGTFFAGLLLALALLSDRLLGPIYLAFPLAAFLHTQWRESPLAGGVRDGALPPPGGRLSFRSLLLLLLGPSVLLAGPSFVMHFGADLADIGASFRMALAGGEVGEFSMVSGWAYYLLILPDNQLHPLLAFLFFLAIPALRRAPEGARHFLFYWVVPALVVLTLLPGRTPTATLPLVPATALITAHALRSLPGGFLRLVLVFVVLGIAAQGIYLAGSVPGANLMGTRLTQDLQPEQPWIGLPLDAEPEWDFAREVASSIVSLSPRGGLIHLGIVGTATLEPHAEPDKTTLGEALEWRSAVYPYRSTTGYLLPFFEPRIRVASSLWSSDWEGLLRMPDRLLYLLVYTADPPASWPREWSLLDSERHDFDDVWMSPRTLEDYVRSSAPYLSNNELEEALELAGDFALDRNRWVRVRQFVSPQGYRVLVYLNKSPRQI